MEGKERGREGRKEGGWVGGREGGGREEGRREEGRKGLEFAHSEEEEGNRRKKISEG